MTADNCSASTINVLFTSIFVGLIGELCNGKGPVFVEDGHFTKLNGIQHITIYAAFAWHGIVDILSHCNVMFLPPRADYLTAIFAFGWYGVSFRWHATMGKKEPLETAVHL